LFFHIDFCTTRPARLDVGLALNLPLLITEHCFLCPVCSTTTVWSET